MPVFLPAAAMARALEGVSTKDTVEYSCTLAYSHTCMSAGLQKCPIAYVLGRLDAQVHGSTLAESRSNFT